MNPHPAFGLIVDDGAIAAGVQSHLERWMDTYLGELGRQQRDDQMAYPSVVTWGAVPDEIPESWVQSPAILVVPQSMTMISGDGAHGIGQTLDLGISVFTQAADEHSALRVCTGLVGAVRAIMTQQRQVDAAGVSVVGVRGTSYQLVPDGQLFEAWGLVTVQVVVLAGIQGDGPLMPSGREPPEGCPELSSVTCAVEGI